MPISRDLSDEFSNKLYEPIPMELLYQSKSTPRTLLDQFLNSAPICLISSSLLFGLPQIETDMPISRDLSDEFSNKLYEPIPMELLYQSKSTPRTLLDQFLNSAPICLISSSLLIPGPRFFQPHPSRNPSFWSSYVLEITYFRIMHDRILSRVKKIFLGTKKSSKKKLVFF